MLLTQLRNAVNPCMHLILKSRAICYEIHPAPLPAVSAGVYAMHQGTIRVCFARMKLETHLGALGPALKVDKGGALLCVG